MSLNGQKLPPAPIDPPPPAPVSLLGSVISFIRSKPGDSSLIVLGHLTLAYCVYQARQCGYCLGIRV